MDEQWLRHINNAQAILDDIGHPFWTIGTPSYWEAYLR